MQRPNGERAIEETPAAGPAPVGLGRMQRPNGERSYRRDAGRRPAPGGRAPAARIARPRRPRLPARAGRQRRLRRGRRRPVPRPRHRQHAATLQSDILCLRHRGAAGAPLSLRRDDDSICIHACHGPMREVEVLHDQLLALFDGGPQPAAARRGGHEPVDRRLRAVHRGGLRRRATPARPRIPYRIADRRVRATDAGRRRLRCDLLDALRGRMTAPEVLDLLAIDAVRAALRHRRRGARPRAPLGHARRACAGASMRRIAPPSASRRWRRTPGASDSIACSSAMPCPAKERALFGGVLPYDDVEGTAADAARPVRGVLRDAVPVPRDAAGSRARSTPGATTSARLLEGMVERTNQTAYQHQHIRAALAALAERAARGRLRRRRSISRRVRAQLDARAASAAPPAHGFLVGRRDLLRAGADAHHSVPRRLPARDERRRLPAHAPAARLRPHGAAPAARRPLARATTTATCFSRRCCRRASGCSSPTSARASPTTPSCRRRWWSASCSTRSSESVRRAPDGSPGGADSSSVRRRRGRRPRRAPARADARRRPPPPAAALQPALLRRRRATPAVQLRATLLRRRRARWCDRDAGAAAVRVGAAAARRRRGRAWSTLDDLVRFFENPSRAFLQRRLGCTCGGDADAGRGARAVGARPARAAGQIGDALLRPRLDGDDLRAALAAVRASGTLPLGVLGQRAFDDLRPRGRGDRRRRRAACAPVAACRRWRSTAMIAGTRITGVLRDVVAGGTGALAVHQARRPRTSWRSGFATWCSTGWRRRLPARAADLVGRPGRGAPRCRAASGRSDDPQALLARAAAALLGRADAAAAAVPAHRRAPMSRRCARALRTRRGPGEARVAVGRRPIHGAPRRRRGPLRAAGLSASATRSTRTSASSSRRRSDAQLRGRRVAVFGPLLGSSRGGGVTRARPARASRCSGTT